MASILIHRNDTWTHALARVFVPPLIAARVRPNHVTVLRAATGLIACGLLATADRSATVWAGVFWLVSAFLDRLDGELARIGRMTSRAGHLFDYATDVAVNSAVFLAMGFGLRHGWLGGAAPWLGVDACVCMFLCNWLSEVFEQRQGGRRIWGEAVLGLHPDDALYLLAPCMWLGWLAPILLGAAAGTTAISLVILVRLALQARRRPAAAGPRPDLPAGADV